MFQSKTLLPWLVAGGILTVGLLMVTHSSAATPPPNPQPSPLPLPPPGPLPPLPPGPTPQPPIIPNPQVAAVLLSQMQALLTQAQSAPDTVQPEQFDALAVALDANGMKAQADDMRRMAAAIRAQRGQVPTTGGTGAPPDKLPDALVDRMTFLLSPANTSPELLDKLAGDIKSQFPGRFLVQLVLIEYRAKELRAGQTAGGVTTPADMEALAERAGI